jgi:hypothetical protein
MPTPRWFGEPPGWDEVKQSWPVNTWWELHRDFTEGRPIDVDDPDARAVVVISGDVAVNIDRLGAFNRVLPLRLTSVVDDVEAVLQQLPRRLPVIVTGVEGPSAVLAAGLRERGWDITTAPATPTTVRVDWTEPSSWDDAEGIHIYYQASGREAHRYFERDAQATVDFIATLPLHRKVIVDPRAADPSFIEVRERLSAAGLSFR